MARLGMPMPCDRGRTGDTWQNLKVPWCPACSHYLTPTSMRSDGTCPFCAQVIDYTRNSKFTAAASRGETLDDDVPVPWHLKLLLAGAALYLGWRAVQGVEWVFHQF